MRASAIHVEKWAILREIVLREILSATTARDTVISRDNVLINKRLRVKMRVNKKWIYFTKQKQHKASQQAAS